MFQSQPLPLLQACTAFVLLLTLGGPVWALDALAAAGIAPSESGGYVKDRKTGLVWPRCAEGMQWNGGACSGEPLLLDRAEAIALAASRKQADGLNWRLPTAAELKGLVKNSPGVRGLDSEMFPPLTQEWFWSSTMAPTRATANQYRYGNIAPGGSGQPPPRVDLPRGWAVSMVTGEAQGDVPSRLKLPVRLTLPSQ